MHYAFPVYSCISTQDPDPRSMQGTWHMIIVSACVPIWNIKKFNVIFFVSIFKDDPQQALILEVIRNDRLRQIERQKYAWQWLNLF